MSPDLRMARDGGIIVEHHKRRSPNHMSEEEVRRSPGVFALGRCASSSLLTKCLVWVLRSNIQMWYVERLQKKHGGDYKAMERDLRLNFKQLSATRLEKQCDKMALYKKELEEEEERKAASAEAGVTESEAVAEDDDHAEEEEEEEVTESKKGKKRRVRRGPIKS